NFNNYAQIQLSSGAFNPSSRVIKLASARKLPAVQELTVKQLLANPEAYESELIRIKNLSIQKGTDTAFKASTNYNVWDGNTRGDTTVLRIVAAADTEIDDAPALKFPAGQFTFEGILIQFCSSPAQGCASGYQLQGTRKADIIPQLGAFGLLTPPTNTRLVVTDGDNTPVQITWEAAANATLYRWMADRTTGNFSNPLLRLNSDNGGSSNRLTLTSGNLSSALQQLGVQQGDSITIQWTVRAYRNTSDSITARSAFNLKLVRFKDPVTSIQTSDLTGFKLFPNPVNDYLMVESASTETIGYSILDATGRVQMTGIVKSGDGLNVQSLQAGVYFFRTEQGTIRFLKH
ncbi:MAG: SusE domain-containing protein, partial [Bacteroidota bacterium]